MEIGPTLSTAIAAILERCINGALRYDPATRLKLNAVNKKVIALVVNEPTMRLYFDIIEDEIHVRVTSELEADVIISGNITDFISALLDTEHTSQADGLKVTGKIQLLNQLRDIFKELDIDWEEPLNEIFGVIPGHALAESIRSTGDWLSRQSQTLREALPEYLTEELRALPSKIELEHFYQDVDQLKAATSRLEQRVMRLAKKQTDNNIP